MSNINEKIVAEEVELSEIEVREEAEVEWFPGDWVICRTTNE